MARVWFIVGFDVWHLARVLSSVRLFFAFSLGLPYFLLGYCLLVAWLPYIYPGSCLHMARVFTFGLDGLHLARVFFIFGLIVVHLAGVLLTCG